MRGVGLVVVLGFLVGEDEVERDLVGLIDHRPLAGDHFAGVKMQNAGDRFQQFFHARQKLVCRLGMAGVGPENDNM